MEKEYDFYSGKKILMDDSFFKLTTDTVLLSSFACIKAGERGLDLGAGVGCLGLLAELKNEGAAVDGIEISCGAADLARRNYENCGGKGKVVCGDFAQYPFTGDYDFVLSNPPYYGTDDGKRCAEEEIDRARHSDISELFKAAGRALKARGRLIFCMRAEKIQSTLLKLSDTGFNIKKMRFVHERADSSAFLVLMEAVREQCRTQVEKPLILRDEKGPTKEYKEIYGIR